jgi:hypothetical protein
MRATGKKKETHEEHIMNLNERLRATVEVLDLESGGSDIEIDHREESDVQCLILSLN